MALDPEIKDKLSSGFAGLEGAAKKLLTYTGKMVKEVGAEAEKKAQNLGNIARLSSERTDLKNKLLKDYAELGKYFYEQNMRNIPGEYAAFFDQIRLSSERLNKVNLELKCRENMTGEDHFDFDNEMSFEQRINEIEKEMAAGSGVETRSFDTDNNDT